MSLSMKDKDTIIQILEDYFEDIITDMLSDHSTFDVLSENFDWSEETVDYIIHNIICRRVLLEDAY